MTQDSKRPRPASNETRPPQTALRTSQQAAPANATRRQADTRNAETKHGGLIDGHDRAFSSGRGYRFDGLVRVAGDQGRWPHVLIMGEGDRYELSGGEGMWEAAAAMRAAGGPAYVPLACELITEGLYAPVIFVDPQAVVIRRFYYHRLPDHAPRNANLLVASLPGRPAQDIFRIRTGHGALSGGDARLADAMRLRRLADPRIPTLVAMDWNSVPSGPMWEDRELNDPRFWPPEQYWARAHRIWWEPGQTRHFEPDTRALDYLLGWWDPETKTRAGGIGFYDVAEMAGDDTPTQAPVPDGRQRRAIDRILVNAPWKEAIVPGSYQVHQPADPEGSFVIITVPAGDARLGAQIAAAYTAGTIHTHPARDIRALFSGLQLQPPGLADAREWMAHGPVIPAAAREAIVLAGVGAKKSRTPPPEDGPPPAGPGQQA